jgi:hypothetical protein
MKEEKEAERRYQGENCREQLAADHHGADR